jgi:hypothetical protein
MPWFTQWKWITVPDDRVLGTVRLKVAPMFCTVLSKAGEIGLAESSVTEWKLAAQVQWTVCPAVTLQFLGLYESVGLPTMIGLVADPHGPDTVSG